MFKVLCDDDDDDDDDNGPITDTNIKKLRPFTGRTIGEMKRDIGVTVYHCCKFYTDEQRHMFCPKREIYWRTYQGDRVNNTKTYQYKPGVHNKILQLVKPVFIELKCHHGKIQNTNESINGSFGRNVRKIYVGRSSLEIGVAVISFKSGASRLLDVMRVRTSCKMLCISIHFVAKRTHHESSKVVIKKAIRVKHYGNG